MPFAQEAHVQSILQPIYGDLVDLLQKAHADWKSSPFAATLQHPKVRANVIWNQFLYHAKNHFEGSALVSVETKGYWQGLVIGGLFFVRMKKGAENFLSSNYPTQSAINFNDANVDLFEGVVRLDLVYTLDDLGSAINQIVVAQRHRAKILWAIDLLGGAESAGQNVLNLPKNPNQGGSPADRVVRPKKIAKEIKKIGNSDDGA